MTNSIDAIAESIKPMILDCAKIISVDGFDRSGKSWVSKFLSEKLNCFHVEIDKFYDASSRDQKTDYTTCKQLINSNTTKGITSIIDGVMIEDELKALDIKPDIRIYVRALNKSGIWVHESLVLASDEEIASLSEGGYPVGDVYLNSLIRDTLRYFKRVDPIKKSDYIFNNQIW